ncbi:MAG: FHA domain-containing protein, partial [Aquihabitans sp.]
MRLRYNDGSRSSDVLADAHHPDATVADLEEALAPERPAGPLWVDGRRVRAATPLDRAGITDGSYLSLDPPPPAPARTVVVDVWVTSGFDSGRCHGLREGRHVLGRDRAEGEVGDKAKTAAQLVVIDPTVSCRHAVLTVTAQGSVTISDLGSTNGTWLDGVAVTAPRRWDPSQEVRVGAARLILSPPVHPAASSAMTSSGGGPTRPRHRAVRAVAPATSDPITPPPPPEPAPVVTPIGAIALVASVGVGLAMVAVMRSWTYAMFALLGPVLMVANTLDSRYRRRRVRRAGGRRRRAALGAFEAELAARARFEVASRAERFTGLRRARAAVSEPAPTCWERRRHHADAYHVLLGFGPAPWVPPVAGGDAVWAPDVAAIVGRNRLLVDAPVGFHLEPGRAVAVVGPPAAARSLVRSIAVQAAVAHGPADLQLAALIGDDQSREWNWLAWLPHTRDPVTGCLLGSDATRVTGVANILATTAAASVSGAPSPTRPHRLVIIDDARGLTERRHPAWTVLRAALDPGT